MNYIDLFSGIGGFALGAYWAGMKFENHYFSEVEPYCVELYQKRFPDAIPLGDITKHEGWKLADGEYIISGGFPCQPYSTSGSRRGKEDDRHLWPSMFGAIQKYKPSWVVGENVTAIDGVALEDVLSQLEGIGYETFPLEIPAAAVGANHVRNRLWILAYNDSVGSSSEGRSRRCIPDGHGSVASSVQGQELIYRPCKYRKDSVRLWETWQGVLPESAVCRRVDGISPELDRLKGLGNAIVPQIAELLFRQIKGVL